MHGKVKSQRKSPSNIKLHAGGGISFGFMRQNNISGRTLSVTDVTSYIFDQDRFASYQLRDEDTDINMILVEGDSPQDSYLALSMPIKEKWLSALFKNTSVKEWFRLKQGDTVRVSADAVIVPQGWLTEHYQFILTTNGSKVSGDYRQKRVSDLAEFYSDTFEYALLVSEDGEYAIEVERYSNGSYRVFATVYRPITDISETSSFQKPYIVKSAADDTAYIVTPSEEEEKTSLPESLQNIPAANPAPVLTLITPHTDTEETAAIKTKKQEDVTISTQPVAVRGTIEPGNLTITEVPETLPSAVTPKPPSEATIAELVESALADVNLQQIAKTSERTTTAADKDSVPETHLPVAKEITPSRPDFPSQLLACNAQLAGRMIEEAQRNKLSLSDVIRKVIDLPKEIDDKIYIPFELSAAEQDVLAKRYQLDGRDQKAIQERIVEELRQFAGVK